MFEYLSEIVIRRERLHYIRLRWYADRLEIQEGLMVVEDFPWRVNVVIRWSMPTTVWCDDAPEVAQLYDGTGWNLQEIDNLLTPFEFEIKNAVNGFTAAE